MRKYRIYSWISLNKLMYNFWLSSDFYMLTFTNDILNWYPSFRKTKVKANHTCWFLTFFVVSSIFFVIIINNSNLFGIPWLWSDGPIWHGPSWRAHLSSNPGLLRGCSNLGKDWTQKVFPCGSSLGLVPPMETVLHRQDSWFQAWSNLGVE